MVQREREDKYHVDQDFTLPDLDGLVPTGRRVESAATTLSGVHYDTGDRLLYGLEQQAAQRARADAARLAS